MTKFHPRYSSLINLMRDANGDIDRTLARTAFSAEFLESTDDDYYHSGSYRSNSVKLFKDDPEYIELIENDISIRDNSDKLKNYISAPQLLRTHSAIDFCNYLGFLMNVEMTIVPGYIGFSSESEATRIVCLIFKRFNDMCRHWKIKNFHVAVFENSKNFGVHSHIALHVPLIHFQDMRTWVASMCANLDPCGNAGRHGKFIRMRLRTRPTIKSQWYWWAYMVKGVRTDLAFVDHRDPDEGTKTVPLHVSVGIRRARKTGIINGKRIRVSQALASKAQSATRFKNIDARGEYQTTNWRDSDMRSVGAKDSFNDTLMQDGGNFDA